jgi:hypothetical protein
MRSSFLSCFFFLASCVISKCEAAPKDDAIRDFVGSVIRSFDNQSDFPDPSEFDAPLPPKGGYLTQFEFDVTQDGVPELFLRSSLAGKVNIYDITASSPRLIAENITLGSEFGVIKDENSLALISCKGTNRLHQGFVRRIFRFQKSGNYTTQESKIDFEAYDKIKNQVDQSANNGAGNLNELLLGTKDIIVIQRASQLPLVSYLSDQASKWSPMNYVNGYGLLLDRAIYTTNSDGSGYKDPELDNDIKSASDCTLLAARSWLKSLNNEERSNQKTNQTSTPRLPRSLQPHGARLISAPLSDEPTSLTPLIALVFVMMTGVSVMLWLFLKNRK